MQLSQDLRERVEREREAHSEHDVLAENRRIKQRFPHVERYPSKERLIATMDCYTGELFGKTILDYGCGRGEASLKYLKNGAAKVCGIDISPVYIAHANEAVREAGYAEEQFSFRVMDAHALEFEGESFDLVVGEGILHHLDAEVALKEIYRVLKPRGRVLLYEPLADNPLLRLFRLLTPNARTEDEAPFTREQIRNLLGQERWRLELVYCGLIEAPVAMLTSILMPKRQDNALIRVADKLEHWTHEQDMLLSWNQYVLFNMVKQ